MAGGVEGAPSASIDSSLVGTEGTTGVKNRSDLYLFLKQKFFGILFLLTRLVRLISIKTGMVYLATIYEYGQLIFSEIE